jgi:hypothetical protein
MAAKIKFHNLILETKAGKWSCPDEPELAAALQQLCDEYFAIPDEYVVNIDEQGAKMVARLLDAEILEITDSVIDYTTCLGDVVF